MLRLRRRSAIAAGKDFAALRQARHDGLRGLSLVETRANLNAMIQAAKASGARVLLTDIQDERGEFPVGLARLGGVRALERTHAAPGR